MFFKKPVCFCCPIALITISHGISKTRNSSRRFFRSASREPRRFRLLKFQSARLARRIQRRLFSPVRIRIRKRKCLFRFAAINHQNSFRAQSFRLRDGINRRVSRADDGDGFAKRNAFPIARFDAFDKIQRVYYARSDFRPRHLIDSSRPNRRREKLRRDCFANLQN
jgi:hypothetical protein